VAEADDDSGEIVLPWWQRPFNVALVAITAAALAGMIGFMIGDARAQIDHNAVDTGFLQDMREHHEQAVQMSYIYLDATGTDPGIRTVARTIARGQSLEVGRMIQLLRSWNAPENREEGPPMDWMSNGHDHDQALDPDDYDHPFEAMPGMATSAQLDALLASNGAEADQMFVELMIAHHQAGIEMAQDSLGRGANDEVELFAESMIRAQTAEIIELENLVG